MFLLKTFCKQQIDEALRIVLHSPIEMKFGRNVETCIWKRIHIFGYQENATIFSSHSHIFKTLLKIWIEEIWLFDEEITSSIKGMNNTTVTVHQDWDHFNMVALLNNHFYAKLMAGNYRVITEHICCEGLLLECGHGKYLDNLHINYIYHTLFHYHTPLNQIMLYFLVRYCKECIRLLNANSTAKFRLVQIRTACRQHVISCCNGKICFL